MIALLSRWLNIRDHERQTVYHFLLFALLVGIGFALGRGSADTLFFKRYGTEYLPAIYTVLGIALVATSTVYAAFADRLASERLAVIILGTLAGLQVLCWWFMSDASFSAAYPFYFLVYQVASEVMAMHIAVYLSQNFDTQQGKRLFPVVFGALETGRIIGGALLAAIAKPLGMANVPVLWLCATGVAIALIVRHHRRAGASPFYRPSPRRRAPLRRAIEQIAQGARFAHRSDLVRAQAGALFFLVICFYVASYAISRVVTARFASEDELGAFLGGLSALTALSSLLIQLLLTGRLLERIGLKPVNLIFPVTNVISHALLLIHFALPTAIAASFNRDTVMPALRNPSRDLLLNVLPDYMQGRVRALLTGLVLPAALIVCGLGLYWLQRTPAPESYLLVGLCAAAALLYYSVRSNRAYLNAILSTLRERLFLPGGQLDAVLEGAGTALFDELRRGLANSDEEICFAHARLLARRFPDAAPGLIAERLAGAAPQLRDRLLHLIDAARLPAVSEQLWLSLANADTHYRATLLERLLAVGDARAHGEIDALLAEVHPRLRATGLYGALLTATSTRHTEAQSQLQALLKSEQTAEVFAALQVLHAVPLASCRDALTAALTHRHARVQAAALAVVTQWPEADFIWHDTVTHLLDHAEPRVRSAALGATRFLAPEHIEERLYAAFDDAHADVQNAALHAWRSAQRARRVTHHMLTDRLLQQRGSPRQRSAALRLLLEHGIDAGSFAAIALALLDDLQELVALRAHIARLSSEENTPAVELLDVVLDERCQQASELIMLALEGTEDRTAVSIIRLGVSSRDRRLRANALGALGEIRNRTIAARLGALLDALDGPRNKRTRVSNHTLAEALAQCAQRPDPWLARCAQHAAGK